MRINNVLSLYISAESAIGYVTHTVRISLCNKIITNLKLIKLRQRNQINKEPTNSMMMMVINYWQQKLYFLSTFCYLERNPTSHFCDH